MYGILVRCPPSPYGTSSVITTRFQLRLCVGSTVPSFRITLAQEEAKWKIYRSYLNKEEKKVFDDMFFSK